MSAPADTVEQIKRVVEESIQTVNYWTESLNTNTDAGEEDAAAFAEDRIDAAVTEGFWEIAAIIQQQSGETDSGETGTGAASNSQ